MQEQQETRVRSLGQEDPLRKEMATHSSILAWRIPWTEEPGGLLSMGSHRVRHDWSDLARTHAHIIEPGRSEQAPWAPTLCVSFFFTLVTCLFIHFTVFLLGGLFIRLLWWLNFYYWVEHTLKRCRLIELSGMMKMFYYLHCSNTIFTSQHLKCK